MSTLILMRHAKALRRPGLSDHARPLTERGRRDAALVARALQEAGLAPDLIIASDSARTRETLEIMAPVFRPRAQERLEPRLYLAASQDMLAVIRSAPPCARLMIIGHNPGMAELAVSLTGRGTPELVTRIVESFPTSAAAVIAFDCPWIDVEEPGGTLARFITAKALRPGGAEDGPEP